MAKEVRREPCKHWSLRFGPILLNFWFVIFLNFHSFGEGFNFCFDGSKEGYRLDTKVIKHVHAESGLDCILQCRLQEILCRSANFRKTCEGQENCELLESVDSEEPAESLKNDENFDHYILLQPKRKPPISCKDILTKSAGATSGLYKISVDNKVVTVYCEMVLHGGGFTFIPKSAVKKGTLPNLVSQLFTNHAEVLLYIQKKNGSQIHTHIRQLKEQPQTPLIVLQNTNSGPGITYSSPQNSFMLDYLYLSTSIYANGFLSNYMEVKYNPGSRTITRYFAFFPNHREQKPSTSHDHDLVYETRGVAVDWRNTGMVLTERIPSNFFYLTEMHYGAGGCYTSSDRWVEANGTAIGLR
ncbi:Hypothetical predicted protein [Paramuricea clavata]|uniref:Uncharacterized protein n=1 Tax=Paramuricea clavata TaxID=317549 RepID=A0A6S7H3I5_PARCT|nr:Hypothetical predicted protein [Paramuricea clavata]